MELLVDISSDSIAKSIVGLSMGYAKQIVPEMAFVLEGDTEETLPEQILAGARLKNLDFKKRDGKRVCYNYA
jgi:Protein ENHANCED DISEASE RESISTANCE 2, C-terminal